MFANHCEIGEIQVAVPDCNGNGYFHVELDFDYTNMGAEGFHVQGNGVNLGDWESFFPFTCESLGFGEELKIKDYLGIYPNPSDGLVNFKNSQTSMLQIEIYDLTGNRINKFDLTQHSVYTINLDEPSLYFYRANDRQSTVSGKFTIR